jgi:cephalosporin hydroxylase
VRLTIDTDAGVLTEETPTGRRDLPLYSPEAFGLLSRQWVAVGWTQKYSYGFTWLGRPVVQLPEDLVRVQEVIWQVQPDVIVETGVAHGGSLVFYAGLCEAMGRGRVIGIDVEIRAHNRAAIESHHLTRLITLVEGSSTSPAVLERVRAAIRPGERVLVLLDSNHSKGHVLAELHAYAPLVSVGSYLVATDGVMADVAGLPGANPQWAADNPREAAREFARLDPRFRLEDPPAPFNEGAVTDRVTYWPSAYLRRVA